jgi:hypothetical protein
MLNKLMKYELRANTKLLIPLYSILFIIAIVSRIFYTFKDYGYLVDTFIQFFAFIQVTFIFVIMIITVLYMIIRFYKNLLTDEGYLMFTLPVKTHHIITSKLLTTLFWILVSIIVALISLVIPFGTPETFLTVTQHLKEAIQAANTELGGNFALLAFEFIIIMLLGMIGNILIIYVSIAIGQLFSKYRIIASFGAYMVIYTVLQFLMIIPLAVFGVMFRGWTPQVSDIPQVIFTAVIVILSIGCAGFYYATHYIFKRKLNLE